MKNSKDKYINSLVSKLINETLSEKADSLVSKIKSDMKEDLGGMEDSHPRFGKLNFSDYTSDEVKDMLRKPMDITVDDEEGYEDEDDMMFIPKRRKHGYEDDEEEYESYEDMYSSLEEAVGMACEQCGGNITEGECMECGWSKGSMEENLDKETKFRPAGSSFDYVQEEEDMEDNEMTSQDMASDYEERVSRFCDTKSEEYDEQSCDYLKNDFLTEEMKENLYGKQKKLDKNKNNKIDSEDFKMLRRGRQETKEGKKFPDLSGDGKVTRKDVLLGRGVKLKGKVSESLQLTEDELVALIEQIIKEDKKSNIKSFHTKGLDVYDKAHKGSGKENDDYLKSVTKKMKEYLKDGSKGQYDTNPEIFPKGNGELAKMSKNAYEVSKDGEEFLDDYMRPGMENLDYDEIHPNEDWMKDNIEGSSKTGNNPDWGNAEKTDLGSKINKKRKENKFAKARRMAANKSPQPVVSDKTGQESGKGLNIKVESTENKKNELLSEEFNRMKNLMGYNSKTQ